MTSALSRSTGLAFPTYLRIALSAARTTRTPFERAWISATQNVPEEWLPILSFLEKHFRAAYNREETRNGRCRIPERDVSHAVSRIRVTDTPTPITHNGKCRSGDKCEEPATRGRFGPMWCERHGRELEGLTLAPYEGRHDRGKAA